MSSSDEAEASVIESDAAPQIFPPGGSRLVVYVVYDRRGQIDPYIPFALRAFRAMTAPLCAADAMNFSGR